LSIVANVASDLVGANSFYERSGFLTSRLKAGGATRGRKINVRILQLETPSLISLMIGPTQLTPVDFIQPKKRATNVPIYAIDLNVFFDAIQNRARSADAGSVIEAALRHQIRLAASQEFVLELERTSHSRNTDPVLSFARRIPSLPSQDKATIEKLIPSVAAIVFPERSARKQLKRNDESDVLHLAHAIAAGASGYITSDSKILNARDELMTDFNFDVIGLTEFVALLDLPRANSIVPTKQTRHCRIQTPKISDILSMLQSEGVNSNSFLGNIELSTCRRTSVGDDEGVIGVSLLTPERGIGQPSRAIVCIRQDHPYSSTIADFLISELIRWRSQSGACHILMLDIPSHPITRRIALGQGFQGQSRDSTTLAKIALGRPITNNSWDQARLAIERLSGLKLQKDCPRYDSQIVCVTSPSGETVRIDGMSLSLLK
jgi:predicted nucleic acid-binding protein